MHPIELESYGLLRERVDTADLPPLSRAVVERVVHGTADPSWAGELVCDEASLVAGRRALLAGAALITDVRMLAAGITSREAIVALDLPGVAELAVDSGLTRTAAGIRLAASAHPDDAVWAIGNAPTALAELIRCAPSTPLVVGVPVGFVGAVAAKGALRRSGLPAVSNRTERGGAAIAAAIVNALLYAGDRRVTRPAPLLLVGHGTVEDSGVAEFAALLARVRRLLAAEGVEASGGFIELSRPTVHEAWSELAAQGHPVLAAVPLVLVAAGHAKGDIPAALEREARGAPGTSYVYGRPLGPHPSLLRLLERHIDEALDSRPREDTAVLLVGRGSTDPDANAEVYKVARLLQEGRGYAFVEAAFVSLALPDLAAGLARCRVLGARRIVVAPYFLFDGVLPRRLLSQSDEFAARDGEVEVRLARHLGDSDELAELVIERYREALHGDVRMNCDTCAYRVLLPGFEDKLGAAQTPHPHPHDVPTHGHREPAHAPGHGPVAGRRAEHGGGSTEQHYLAGLDLTGRRVVVVGGGTVAQRRLPRLLAAGSNVELIAPSVTPAVEAMATGGELRWTERRYADDDLADAWYVLACTDDPTTNAAVAAAAERNRVFCVRADDAPRGTAVTPAVGEHDGLVVGVLAGRRPRRSAAVRTALVEALRSGLVSDDAEVASPGVALVGGGPGDPDLITVRGRRLLSRADVVVTDRLAPRELLEELGPHVEVVDASKIPYGRAMNQEKINELIVDRARAGKFVVRLKGGDPYVFGRGFEEVIACARAGVAITVVPGVTSAFAVPASADVPVTHRGVAHEVVVVSGHVAPGDPRSLVDWPALGRLRGTLVLLMAVERIGAFAAVLVEHGRPADTPVVVVQDGTLRIQRSVHCTLGDVAAAVAENDISPPAVVVIGPVAGLTSRG